MKVFGDISDEAVTNLLANNNVGVIRTDTLYGLVARAASEEAVRRIFHLKDRAPNKPLLLLIADNTQLIDKYDTSQFEGDFWPGPNTIILPSPTAPDYLTCGTKTLAYRIPADESLRKLVKATGPLVAPSANPEGKEPSHSVQEAINYFGETVDFYVDGGEVVNNIPSKLWQLRDNDTMERLR